MAASTLRCRLAFFLQLLSLAALAQSVEHSLWWPHHPQAKSHSSGDYILVQSYNASNLLDGFKFMTAADYPSTGDPTKGFVNYVDASTAQTQGLAKVLGGKLFLGVDNNTILETSMQGRSSVRLESKQTWSTGLLIADIAHMPGNECGVWPALWSYNFGENPIAEIDILEGIGHQSDNMFSLHTGTNCTFGPGWQTGKEPRMNCALVDRTTNKTNYVGCGATIDRPASYGTAFNQANGGVYATLLENNAIRVWNWARKDIPRDILMGRPRPQSWGKPVVDLSGWNGGCDVGKTFHTQTIIINTDFCGNNMPQTQWAADPKCSMHPTCKDFVAKNPGNFSEAYWLINSIKVYERGIAHNGTEREPSRSKGPHRGAPQWPHKSPPNNATRGNPPKRPPQTPPHKPPPQSPKHHPPQKPPTGTGSKRPPKSPAKAPPGKQGNHHGKKPHRHPHKHHSPEGRKHPHERPGIEKPCMPLEGPRRGPRKGHGGGSHKTKKRPPPWSQPHKSHRQPHWRPLFDD